MRYDVWINGKLHEDTSVETLALLLARAAEMKAKVEIKARRT